MQVKGKVMCIQKIFNLDMSKERSTDELKGIERKVTYFESEKYSHDMLKIEMEKKDIQQIFDVSELNKFFDFVIDEYKVDEIEMRLDYLCSSEYKLQKELAERIEKLKEKYLKIEDKNKENNIVLDIVSKIEMNYKIQCDRKIKEKMEEYKKIVAPEIKKQIHELLNSYPFIER